MEAADLTSCDISACAPDGSSGLQAFTNLVALDVSDNRLTCLAGLVALPALQQLAVSANRLSSLTGLAHKLGLGGLEAAQAQQGPQPEGAQQSSHATTPQPACLPQQAPAALACSAWLQLAVLDVSYNMLTGAQLLGQASPLGHLPR
jgi:Leucine-rich repeat (LRR) protein